jgi:type I restriction enzyme R subunit
MPAMHQSPDRTRRARRLRADMTGAESILWEMLRGRNFHGLKFRRQAPVAGFVVDFLCPELRLVLELDGGIHDLRGAEDAARDERLRVAGYTVLRFRNNRFTTNPNVLLDAIRAHRASMLTHPPHPSGSAARLLPRGEKGDEEE